MLKKEDLPREFKLVEINKYLEHLKADPIFYHSKSKKKIKSRKKIRSNCPLALLIGAIFF